jgi:hypothetical protein
LYIERGKRRGEIALYVLPRAIRTLFKESWLRSGSRSVLWAERFVHSLAIFAARVLKYNRIAFACACSALVTFAKHDSSSLRGLSRWGLGYVYEGWGALRRKKEGLEEPDTNDVAESVIIIREPEPPSKDRPID